MTTPRDDDALLKEEYFRLQQMVEEFDGKSLTIKAWSVTLSAAGIVAAYVEKAPIVLLIASGSALVFWMVEALWKTNQQAFYPRIRLIENHFSGSDNPVLPLQIAHSWSAAWRQRGRARFAFTVMWWWHVALPHIAVAVVAALLFFVAPPAVPSA